MYERQRVWRACQACRKKKVKCDGEHPCQSCTRNKAECVYVEPHSNMRLVDPQYVLKLESRLSLMEQRLRQQSNTVEAREEAIQPEHSTETVMGSHNDIDHHPRLTGDKSANTVDRGALSDPLAGSLQASSVDVAVQTPQQPSTISLLMGGQNNEDAISDSLFDCHPTRDTLPDITRLEDPLMQVLIHFFYQSIYPIFPIIPRRRFHQQYDLWHLARKGNSSGATDPDFQPLLYALLAVSASIISEDRAAFPRSDFGVHTWLDLADQLYQHAISLSAGKSYQKSPSAAINAIAAQGLLSLYLIERGKVNDAWVTAGHAIRLYQGLDLQESFNFASEAKDLRLAHRNLWWCLYILDRSLSTALLKPLAIDDADSDIESCDEQDDASSTAAKEDPWFSVIADFHITMGRIYRSVRLIQKADSSQNAKLKDTLRSSVKRHDAELEKYYTKQVLPKIGTPNPQMGPLALQTIAVSSYYIGLVLLYRTFIERFNITEPESLLRCAEAASNCIKVTPQVIAHVPASHFVIQQSRAIFASTKVLLHCMRLARNPNFTKKAWSDVESGLKMLREVKIQWPEIKKYQLLTEEDMRLTQDQLTKDALFSKTFELFGQTACTGGAGEREITRARHPSPPSEASLDLREVEQFSWELSNVARDDSLANDCAQSPASRKQGRLDEPSQQRSKRRRLFRQSSPRLTPGSDPIAVDILSTPRDFSAFPITDHMMTTGDLLLLPDTVPHQTPLEELSASFFGDAMLMSSIDQFFSQHDAG